MCLSGHLAVYLLVICRLLLFNVIQGGPAKVKPTYIFAGNVWYLNV